jgi:acyl carrier protein
MTSSEIEDAIRAIFVNVLGLDADRVASFDNDTPLFGSLPELDSMAVAGLLTELEDRLHFIIEDDEVSGEMLETFGALKQFARKKLAV